MLPTNVIMTMTLAVPEANPNSLLRVSTGLEGPDQIEPDSVDNRWERYQSFGCADFFSDELRKLPVTYSITLDLNIRAVVHPAHHIPLAMKR